MEIQSKRNYKVPKSQTPTLDCEYFSEFNFNKIKNENDYKMSKFPRGYCVIFNMIYFDDDEIKIVNGEERWKWKRNDADKYIRILEFVFIELGFITQIYQNYNDEQLKHEINNIINSEECDDHDAIVLYIGTHGYGDGFYCSNKEFIKDQEIIDLFSNENCKRFFNKPKLIFFDHCRGDKYTSEAEESDDDDDDDDDEDNNKVSFELHTNDDVDSKFSDLYVCYSTPKKSFSIRGLFIKEVCNMLMEYSNEENLINIIKKASKSMQKPQNMIVEKKNQRSHQQKIDLQTQNENKKLFFNNDEKMKVNKLLDKQFVNQVHVYQSNSFNNKFIANCFFGGDKTYDFKKASKIISENCSLKHFNSLTINNPLEVLEESIFDGISFDYIVIMNCTNLTKIHKNPFGKATDKIKGIEMINLPKLRSQQDNYDLNQLFNNLINCEQLSLTPYDHMFKGFNLSKLKSIEIDGSTTEIKIESIENYAFYECEQINEIIFKNNRIKKIKSNAFRLKSDSKERLQVQFFSNQINNDSFEISSLIIFCNKVYLELYEDEITFLSENIFKPFFDCSIDNNTSSKLLISKFDFEDARNDWLLNDGKIKYPVYIHDSSIERICLERADLDVDIKEQSEDDIFLQKGPVECHKGYKSELIITGNTFRRFKKLNQAFEIISEFSEIKHFDRLEILNFKTITSLDEITFGKLIFNEITIVGWKYLERIRLDSFKEISNQIKIFNVINSPSLVSQPNSDYDLNELINSLTNCEELRFKPFQKELKQIQLVNLKVFSFDGVGSSVKIESIEDYAFYECDKLEYIFLQKNNINLIGERSFHFKNESNTILTIFLSENKLNGESFSLNSLNNIKRPIRLYLNDNQIEYLKEDIFKSFISDKYNYLWIDIELIRSENQWLHNEIDKNSKIKFKDRLFSDMKLADFVNTSEDSSDEYSHHFIEFVSEWRNTLISSIIHDESISKQLCTFLITKVFPINQLWYHCNTCLSDDQDNQDEDVGDFGVCQVCADVCHKGHDIQYSKKSEFYCKCWLKDGSCKALVGPFDDENKMQEILFGILNSLKNGEKIITDLNLENLLESRTKQLHEESVAKNVCSFSLTQDYFVQDWFYCFTCNLINDSGCCFVCAQICHKGHHVKYAKKSEFFCDCGAKEDGSCRTMIRVSTSSLNEQVEHC